MANEYLLILKINELSKQVQEQRKLIKLLGLNNQELEAALLKPKIKKAA